MNHNKYLPDHWKENVKKHALKLSKGKRGHFECGDFNKHVKIRFEDGSFCNFIDAFWIKDAEKDEICVITEHCGYHIFYSEGLEIIRYKEVFEVKDYYIGKWFD